MGFQLAGMGFYGLGVISEPFPEWYTPAIPRSTATLTPASSPVPFPKVRSVSAAIDYAAGSWQSASKETPKDTALWQRALARYRFAYDLGKWGSKAGLSIEQGPGFVKHLKTKIESGNQALRESRGVEPPRAPGDIPQTSSDSDPTLPTQASIISPFSINPAIAAGAAILLYALFFRKRAPG